jgi:hypothetical protein
MTGNPETPAAARLAPVLAAALAVLALTLPRAVLDYGYDPDAARSALAGRNLALTGTYVPSRLPGNPLFEYALALLSFAGGHAVANLFVLLTFALAVAAFHGLAREHPHGGRLTVLFAFTPLLLQNAATTMDYIPALAAMLWSWRALRAGREATAGILLGLCIGCRLPWAIFAVPGTMEILARRRGAARAILFAAVGASTGLLFYVPIFPAYADRFHELGSRVRVGAAGLGRLLLLAGYNAVGLLGAAATLVLAVLFAAKLPRIARSPSGPPDAPDGAAVELAGMAVFAALFALHPDESAYLLPALPFLYLFAARHLSRSGLAILAGAVLSHGLVTLQLKAGASGNRRLGVRPSRGILIEDYAARRARNAMRSGIADLVPAGPAVVMTAMGPALTLDNDRVEPVPALPVPLSNPDAFLDSNEVFRVKGRDVYLVYGLAPEHVADVRRSGYAVHMFPKASAALRKRYRYDISGLDVHVIPIREFNL